MTRLLRLACGVVVALLVLFPAAAQTKRAADPYSDPNAIRVLLSAENETTLSVQMSGTLGPLKARLGQKVAKGDTLVALECGEATARAQVAEAELAMARQNLTAKQSMRKLDAIGDIEVASARTDVQKAAGARTLANTQASYCRVRAPFGGRIAKVYVRPYQTISAGTPVFDLVGDGPLRLRLNVPSAQMRNLRDGMPFQLQVLETGKTYPAHVSAVNARVDAVAQTVELEGRLDAEHPELIAGMSGIAKLGAPK